MTTPRKMIRVEVRSPVRLGRRIYRPGELLEADEAVVAPVLATGSVVLVPAPAQGKVPADEVAGAASAQGASAPKDEAAPAPANKDEAPSSKGRKAR